MSRLDLLWVALPTLGALAVFLVRARRRQVPAVRYLRSPSLLRVVANVDAPNRNLSETLPQRNRAQAEADRHFYGYERVRAPRYRPNVDEDRAEELRPVQVIRVSNQIEREQIAQQIPPHLKVIFLEEDPVQSTVAPPLSRD